VYDEWLAKDGILLWNKEIEKEEREEKRREEKRRKKKDTFLCKADRSVLFSVPTANIFCV
jgi:hypothetical protein